MRLHLATIVLLAACSHQTIGPDDGGKDAALVDGAIPDGSTNDGGNAKSEQGFTAGSRLKVRYYVGSDGSEQALGFYDTQRNENCDFVTASDGVVRCMTSAGYTVGPGTYFSDACVTPLIAMSPTCPPPPTGKAYLPSSTTCGALKFDVYTLGSAYTGATIYTKSGTTCSGPTNVSTITSVTFYTVASTIPASSFQDATEVVK